MGDDVMNEKVKTAKSMKAIRIGKKRFVNTTAKKNRCLGYELGMTDGFLFHHNRRKVGSDVMAHRSVVIKGYEDGFNHAIHIEVAKEGGHDF